MTPDVRARLHESWELASPHADALATCFYARLFEIDVAAGRLFADTDMEAQRGKFVTMLDRIVRAVDEPRTLVPDVTALARRHVAYGVEDRHYASVGEALLFALGETLGDLFTSDVHAAWVEAYALLAALMQRGAARPASSPSLSEQMR
ncbi:MAG TPA: globin domain-containing protein [Gemmatimonadaceae bacterium]|nr:globin domain-containing protein [Gemmatimonadaceae bacterium]